MPKWLLLVLAAVINSLLGTVIAKRWITTHDAFLFWLSLVFFLLSSLAWIWVLKLERLTIVSAVWDVMYLVLAVALGLLVYHETINWQEALGLVLAVTAVILLTVKF